MKKIICFVFCIIFICTTALTAFCAEKTENEELPDDIKAASAILVEASSGKVLFEYNADEKRSPASVTKIMTILLVCEALDNAQITLADKVTCSKNAASKGGSQIWLKEGEVMTVDELLKATVIGSANDAATLLGEYVAGSEEAFIALMNERASQLGMKNTHFENATGLDDTTDSHLSTARDIAVMSCELLKHGLVTDYSTVWMDSLRGGKTELVNTNKLVRFYKGTTGLKTGTTSKAGCCIAASAERDGLSLVAVVLGSDNSNERFESAKALLNRGFSEYAVFTPEIDKTLITDVIVLGGEYSAVSVSLPDIDPILIKKGDAGMIEQKVEISTEVQAPVLKNQTLGTVSFLSDGKVLTQYSLKASKDIKELTFKASLIRLLRFIGCGIIENY